MNKNFENARNLRKNLTTQERLFWNLVRNKQINNLRFKRQVPIGNYIVDFSCYEKMLIVELDGGQHNETDNIEYDKQRTKYLESLGYTVLRFWNNDIDNNIDGVYQTLLKYLK